jgi:serine/threonine protein kinase
VFLATKKGSDKKYAVKSIRKDIILEHDLSIESHILEKDIMLACDHPFLVNMECMLQNDLRLYFVMPFVRGGELYKVF